jgi:uncharacterized membrane protein YgcG
MKRILWALLVVSMGWTPAFAEGAIAVGLSSNVAKSGVAAGAAGDMTYTEAQSTALQQCKDGRAASTSTRALCKVVATFNNKCAAIAADPKPGTPGFGWAVSLTADAAERWALNKCEATAGPGRRAACKVVTVTCDSLAVSSAIPVSTEPPGPPPHKGGYSKSSSGSKIVIDAETQRAAEVDLSAFGKQKAKSTNGDGANATSSTWGVGLAFSPGQTEDSRNSEGGGGEGSGGAAFGGTGGCASAGGGSC